MWSRSGLIVAAGESETETLASGGLPCRSALAVKITGTTGFSVVLSLQASPDEGTTWVTLPFVDLTGTDADLYADNVTLTTEVTRLVAGLEWVPVNWTLRFIANNSGGTQAATLSLWIEQA